ncbi:MAG: hypothetical protein HRT99_01235 [Mycoplasmatales bacterium]|nr:hypothetical protein [Mycoplasmatales bacterium]
MYKIYLKEIMLQIETARKIEAKFKEPEIIDYIYTSATINMCIKYEAFIADYYQYMFDVSPRYNHPWANTRDIAKKLNKDISWEYKIAHDLWDYYNSLKHINSATSIEKEKIIKKYNLKSSKHVAEFVHKSLGRLVKKLTD